MKVNKRCKTHKCNENDIWILPVLIEGVTKHAADTALFLQLVILRQKDSILSEEFPAAES